MPGVIFLIQGEKLIELREETYNSEDLFQKLLADYPKLLAGDQIDNENPRRWLLISREMGVPDSENSADRWALDHLFIDQDGIPTFVEVKRSTDTRIRREVVAQMLDYAANGVEYWRIPELKIKYEQSCEQNGQNPAEVMRQLLGPETDYDRMWRAVEDNLQNQKLRLLFVADEIPKELKRIVEFLNEKMRDVEVLAIEVRQFTGENIKTLVPRVIGQTSQAVALKNAPSTNWDAESFLEKIGSDVGTQERASVKDLMDWFKENQIIVRYGRGSKYANAMIHILLEDGTYVSPFNISSDATISIRFDRLKNSPVYADPEKRKALVSEIIAKIGEVKSFDKIDSWPTFKLALLNSDEKRTTFKEIILQIINELNANIAT